MSRKSETAEDTVTVRLPAGVADKVRALTGQPFSTVVRWMCIQLIERKTAEINLKEAARTEVQSAIGEALDGD